MVDAREGGRLGERAASGHLGQVEGGGAPEQPGIPADMAGAVDGPEGIVPSSGYH